MRAEMDRIVTDYGSIPRIPQPIDGTAAFPGGTGLWRGLEPHGPLPLELPRTPYFILAHNFDSVRSYQKSIVRGSEKLDSNFWSFLLLYCAGANVDPAECFITNALMGLQSQSAQGRLRGGGPQFEEQCLRFLEYEIAVTKPEVIIVLGEITTRFLRRVNNPIPVVPVRHTSSFNYIRNDRKQVELEKQIDAIARVVGRGTSSVEIPVRYRPQRERLR
jgi:hypothetical protein